MNNKLISLIGIAVLFIGIFTVFATVVNAKSLNLLCSKKQKLKIILKNEANIDISKDKISKIPNIKIIKITYRDEEWSRMVNKMDLPKMENPFKNEFIIKMNKKANTDEIYNKIKEMDFVESAGYVFDKKCTEQQNQ